MSREAISTYLYGHFQKVEGWCSPHLWQLIQPIADAQERAGIANPVAEVGVFHGKFFIGLLATKGAPNNNYAFDVFDLQRFNLDGAGRGNLQIFKKNIAASGFSEKSVECVEIDSMSISTDMISEIRSKSGGFSFFSVDGCHKLEHTLNDIRIAMQFTVPQGIIFVDDYTNQMWPEVQEAVVRLYLFDCPRFVPLAFGHNKLLLCHVAYHAEYLALLEQTLAAAQIRFKRVSRSGYPSLTAVLDPNSQKYFPD